MRLAIVFFLFILSQTMAQSASVFLNDLQKAQTLIKNKRYVDAEKQVEKLLLDCPKIYGYNSKVFSQLCFLKGFINIRLKNIEKASQYLGKSISINESLKNDNTKQHITTLFVLGELYAFTGKNKEAEILIDKAVNNIGNVYTKESTSYYSLLNKAGGFYNSLKLYDKAEPILNEIIEFTKKRFGKNIDYVVANKNLAMMYINSGRQDNGVKILSEIIPLSKKIEKNTPFSNQSISFYKALAEIYFYSRDYFNATMIYEKILSFYQKNDQHFEYSSFPAVLNNLGEAYSALGENKKAIKYLLLSLNEQKKRKIINSEDYIGISSNISLMYWKNNEYVNSEKYFINTIGSINKSILEKESFMSEAEKESFYLGYKKNFDIYNSFALQNLQLKESQKKVYNNTLLLKNQLLKSSISLRNHILESDNPILISKFNKWIKIKKTIASLFDKKHDETKIAKLEQEAKVLERFLISNSDFFNQFKQANNFDWKTIKNKLKPNEIAIEFIDFNYYGKNWTGEKYYCALLIKSTSNFPELQFLFKEYQLKKLLNRNVNNEKEEINALYNSTSSNHEKNLYELVWMPLENKLNGIKNIYYSPSGLLNNISFSALHNGSSLLIDNHNLFRLTSTSKISDLTKKTTNFKTATLYGGIDYGTSTNKWEFLNGAEEEINEIANILNINNVKSELYTGKNATEDNFKKTVNSQIVHISTHGFFKKQNNNDNTYKEEYGEVSFDNIDDSRSSSSTFNNSLNRSGLVFAGANDNEEAILNAFEVSNLYINNLDLLVLSACETGLGDIKGNEGVYGLQRAFKMAGAKYLIVSLWKVPDKETKEFMITFYNYLFELNDIELAFKATQKNMSKKYSSYFWGAFILIK